MNLDWKIIIQNIIVSSITAVLFTGGVNYLLQKKNRRANIIYEKGYKLIDEIYAINNKRIKASLYVTIYNNVPDDVMNQFYYNYKNECLEFQREDKKTAIFLNKRTNRKLEEYISYLKQVEEAFDNNMKGEDYSIAFDQRGDELCSQIIELIKKSH